MPSTQAIYYRDGHGFQPVEEFLLHMLRKNTGRLPASDIEIARERWADFKTRMDASPRRPPRAAGRDAP